MASAKTIKKNAAAENLQLMDARMQGSLFVAGHFAMTANAAIKLNLKT